MFRNLSRPEHARGRGKVPRSRPVHVGRTTPPLVAPVPRTEVGRRVGTPRRSRGPRLVRPDSRSWKPSRAGAPRLPPAPSGEVLVRWSCDPSLRAWSRSNKGVEETGRVQEFGRHVVCVHGRVFRVSHHVLRTQRHVAQIFICV